MITYTSLRARYLDDTGPGGPGATPALTRALDRVGWSSVQDSSPDDLASYLVYLLEACVREHRDVMQLAHGVAEVMRDSGPLLDGSMPPAEAYLPAAEELLRLYVTDTGGHGHP